MNRSIISWFSPALEKEMPVAVYGHFGFALIMIPTAGADFLEYERFQLMDAIRPLIEEGKLKVYSIDSMNQESWMNDWIDPAQKMKRHMQWNDYVFNELLPYVKKDTSKETPVYVCGASFGSFHSANLFFKRPDLLDGCICLSGVYDLTEYTRGYYDENVYFNSPMHFMPNMADDTVLEQIRKSAHIHLFSGSGEFEEPDSARRFAGILYRKNIWYDLNIWGPEWRHDWPTWRTALPHILGSRF